MSKISMIIPFYNVEDYIIDALDSVVNQTIFQDLEVILIDDGSRDGSTEIAKSYAEKYPNIAYYHKENGGISDARNYGLQFVTSKYTMYMDSDDMYTPQACESLYNFAEEKNLKLVVGELELYPGKSPNYDWKKYFGHGNQVIDLSVAGEELIKMPSAFNKIFRTEILLDKEELFPVGLRMEDAFAMIPLMVETRVIGLVDEKVYLYRQRDDASSYMDTVYNNEENYYVYIKLIQSLHNQLIVGEKNEQIIYAVQKFITKSYHGFLINIFLKDLITFSEEEKAWTFDQIQPIYQDVNYKMVEKLSEHRIMKTIYYGLVTNNKSLFVNPILNVDRIVIRDKILTHPDYLRKLEMHSIHLYAAIERFIEDDEDYVFIGELVSNNAYINHNLQNSFVFLLKELEGQTLECPVQKFNKLESPYRKQENDAPCGIKVRIPKSYVNNKIGSLELQMCIIEKATQERKYIGVLAHDLLHQYKREGNQPISLNIRENRTIEMIIDEMPEDSATDETV